MLIISEIQRFCVVCNSFRYFCVCVRYADFESLAAKGSAGDSKVEFRSFCKVPRHDS